MEAKMIGVIGSGSWATALIKILLEKEGRELHWWVRNEAARQAITSDGHNPRHLTSVALDHNRLHLSGDLHTVAVIPDGAVLGLLISMPVCRTVKAVMEHSAN